MLGTLVTMSAAWRTPRSVRSLAESAVTAIGTSCSRSLRRSAVTTISSSVVSARAATGTTAVAMAMAAHTAQRTVSSFMTDPPICVYRLSNRCYRSVAESMTCPPQRQTAAPPGSAAAQRGDAAGGGAGRGDQQWRELLAQLVERCAAGGAGDVDGRHRAAAFTEDRCGDGQIAPVIFLVGPGVTRLTRFGDPRQDRR